MNFSVPLLGQARERETEAHWHKEGERLKFATCSWFNSNKVLLLCGIKASEPYWWILLKFTTSLISLQTHLINRLKAKSQTLANCSYHLQHRAQSCYNICTSLELSSKQATRAAQKVCCTHTCTLCTSVRTTLLCVHMLLRIPTKWAHKCNTGLCRYVARVHMYIIVCVCVYITHAQYMQHSEKQQ